jgi:hypothetical protein
VSLASKVSAHDMFVGALTSIFSFTLSVAAYSVNAEIGNVSTLRITAITSFFIKLSFSCSLVQNVHRGLSRGGSYMKPL